MELADVGLIGLAVMGENLALNMESKGNKVAVYDPNGNLVKTVDIVIFGDVNGDGKVTIKDIMLTNRNILKKISLNGEYLEAADVNKDGKVTIKDIMLIKNSILGKSKLTQ